MFDSWVDSSCIRLNRSWVSDSSGRSKDRYRIIRWTVRHHSHSDEHDQEIDENGSICKDPELLERTDLPHKKAANGPNETADGVAKFEFGDLRNSLAVTDDNVADTEEELHSLQEVDDVARYSTVNTERKIGISLAGKFVRIKAEKACP